MPTTTPSGEIEAIEDQLKRLTISIFTAFESGDINFLRKASFISCAFTAWFDGHKEPVNLETHFKQYQDLRREHPQRRLALIDSTATVDQAAATAQVYVMIELSGQPLGIAVPGIGVWTWRKMVQQDQWVCISQRGVRGGMTTDHSPLAGTKIAP